MQQAIIWTNDGAVNKRDCVYLYIYVIHKYIICIRKQRHGWFR